MATAVGGSSEAFLASAHSALRAARVQDETSTASASSETFGAATSMTIRAPGKKDPLLQRRHGFDQRKRAVRRCELEHLAASIGHAQPHQAVGAKQGKW